MAGAPAWLKPIGDAAFCAGVNRINVHHFVQQPWDAKYKPGNAMGQWGIHLGRYQTWWKPGKAWITYLWRCQTLLQRGQYIAPTATSTVSFAPYASALELQSIHRRDGETDIYFVANLSWEEGVAHCSFPPTGKQPELWDPLAGTMRELSDFDQSGGSTRLPLHFAPCQSFFILFRRPVVGAAAKRSNFPSFAVTAPIDGNWDVVFDPTRGGPATAKFEALEDWTTRKEEGIKYYSGTATYKKTVNIQELRNGRRIYLDLGTVKHIAEVTLNGKRWVSFGQPHGVSTSPWPRIQEKTCSK